MRKENVLIVDDSIEMLEVLRRQLTANNFYTFQATNVTDAIEILKTASIDLLITDLQMPGIDGMQLIRYVTEHFPKIPTLVITGYPSVSGAVEALQSGVFDYLVKPFTQDELLKAVENTLGKISVTDRETNTLATEIQGSVHGIIGHSEKIKKLLDIVYRVRDVRATVLIMGESGTGKELIARAVHYTSKRAKAPFIVVNCGGIPENLLESELFGFMKGAFTGANETRPGFFQAADGGTLFLDEIGNAPLSVQMRLLRFIQEKEITMIGSNKAQKVDVRIIAATNNQLEEMVRQGRFREDLFYRLNVVTIQMPPLRERIEDIPLLARFFVRKYSEEFNKRHVLLSDKVSEVLKRHTWPGNIRELENVIQRALLMCENEIEIEHLPDNLKINEPQLDHTNIKTLHEMEKEYILSVLAQFGNNKTKAAEALGIDRKTLRQKLS